MNGHADDIRKLASTVGAAEAAKLGALAAEIGQASSKKLAKDAADVAARIAADHAKQLGEAAKALTDAHAKRTQAILEAHAANVTTTAIAEAVQMSRMQVHRIISATKDGADE